MDLIFFEVIRGSDRISGSPPQGDGDVWHGRPKLPKRRVSFPSAPSNGAGFQAILAMNMGEPAMALVALAAVDSGPMRLILFILVLVAVILIIVGCIIALLTWRKRQQVYSTYMNAIQLERDKV